LRGVAAWFLSRAASPGQQFRRGGVSTESPAQTESRLLLPSKKNHGYSFSSARKRFFCKTTNE
jgi:hypothetical protein